MKLTRAQRLTATFFLVVAVIGLVCGVILMVAGNDGQQLRGMLFTTINGVLTGFWLLILAVND